MLRTNFCGTPGGGRRGRCGFAQRCAGRVTLRRAMANILFLIAAWKGPDNEHEGLWVLSGTIPQIFALQAIIKQEAISRLRLMPLW